MRVTRILPVLVLFLAGCGGGLPSLPRLADVPVAQTGGQVAALEGAATVAPEPELDTQPRRGLLGFLGRRAQEAVEAEETVADGAAEAGLTVDDVAATEAALTDGALEAGPETAALDPSAAALPGADVETTVLADPEPPRRGGLLGLLRRNAEAQQAEDPVATAAAEVLTNPAEEQPLLAAPAAAQQETAEIAQEAEAPVRRGGLLGLFGGNRRNADGAEQVAALPQQSRNDAAPRRAGPSPDAPDYAQVGPGVTLPYGQIARLCGAPQSILGRKVDKAPARGRGFTLHDTAPGTTGAHTFFLTGFSDGCARQFTAALVLFSTPETYEQFRFGAPGRNLPKSTTDAAYDRLKSRVCGVPTNKACGSQVSKLARNTVFVSVYERVGSNPKWKTMLLHDGQLMAMDVKS